MVAYTPDFCLPYFEGTDSPCVDTGQVCAPSTVWCDMAAKIDEAFTGYDETISRAVTSFPYAQVAISDTPATFSSGASNLGTITAIWDTVVGDSDAMVDLNVDPASINLKRSGIWNLNCIVVWRNDVNDSELRARLVLPTAPKITSIFNAVHETWVEPVPDPTTSFLGRTLGLSNVIDAFYLVDTSTGPAPIQVELEVAAGASGNDPIIEVCRFSARWVADRP